MSTDASARLRSIGLATLLAATGSAAVPAATPAAPHSFVATATDQIAVPGHAAGTEITPEGYLYTGAAELVYRIGPRLRPFDQSVRTLAGGRYPVISSVQESDGVSYRVTTFAAPVAGAPVNFLRIEMVNRSGRTRYGHLAVAVRHSGGALKPSGVRRFRYLRPAIPARPGLYLQPGQAFERQARHRFQGPALLRDEALLYSVLRADGRVTRRLGPAAGARARPGTLVGMTGQRARLRPRGRARIDVVMPVTPGSPGPSALTTATFERHRAATLRDWRRRLAPAMRIDLPEAKVEDAFYASLMHALMARYRLPDGRWVQTVNKLQYHAFWLRDAAVITHAYDLAGLHREAGENLDFFLDWQGADGLFISRPDQYDGHGQALWAFAEHVHRTGDLAFARRVLPAVGRAVDWLAAARRAPGARGLLKPSTPGDNELVTGRVTGDAIWALAGLDGAVRLARALGEEELVRRWSQERGEFRTRLIEAIRTAARRSGGRIPPALDRPGGQDWGNLWAAYPFPALAPTDPAVTATLRHARRGFREGIATYLDGRHLHHYLGFRVFQTELLRGQQRAVVRGLYDSLAHTTATHGGFETGIRPFGNRSVDDNMTPHGWFAAEYVALLRNMLVRQRGNEVWIASALSPAWLRPGRRVAVSGAPTAVGPVSWALRSRRGGAVLTWRTGLPRGVALRWPVPAFAREVVAGGRRRRAGEAIVLPGRSGRMVVRWRLGGVGESFDAAVRRLRSAYARRGR